jgi:hypothetical protein
MKKIQSIVFTAVDDYRSILPRLIVGLVFLSEGIQKFLFPELVDAGRFEKIGFTNSRKHFPGMVAAILLLQSKRLISKSTGQKIVISFCTFGT